MEWLNNNAFVKSVYKKFKITWGGFNLLKAELFLIKQAVANKEVDYIHVMSAQDYPIRNLKFIKTVFEREVGTEFLSYHRIPLLVGIEVLIIDLTIIGLMISVLTFLHLVINLYN